GSRTGAGGATAGGAVRPARRLPGRAAEPARADAERPQRLAGTAGAGPRSGVASERPAPPPRHARAAAAGGLSDRSGGGGGKESAVRSQGSGVRRGSRAVGGKRGELGFADP